MKIPKQQREDLINKILPLLGTAIEEGTELMEVSGAVLTSNGVTRDAKNNPIVNGKKYLYPVEKMVPVDHRFKLSALIEQAKDVDQMQTLLGEYLAKYARSKSEVLDTIKK